MFNAQSVGNKSASIQRWISDAKLNIGTLVETWHDDACMPPGFRYLEKARQRPDGFMKVNHGGVCMLYDHSLQARRLQLPNFSSFEVIAAYLHRSGFNAVVVVIYRPGSQVITQSFFKDFGNLLEHTATFSAQTMIVGDLNVHVDDVSDANARRLSDMLDSHNLVQHIEKPTQKRGHTLDLVITRADLAVSLQPVDPPLLSDHSFVVVDIDS